MKYFVTSKLSENIHETPEGYLVCIGVSIARTGEMVYGEGETPLETDDDGKIIIDREESEVFRPETVASFEGKAVTITHPVDFVGPDNWGRLAKGILQNVRRGEDDQSDDLIADLLITDSVAINLVKSGLREVSCGYEAEYTQTGDGRGKQTNIIGNHLALVDKGRAGPAYAINDRETKGAMYMKIGEKIKAIFARAQDEAMKVADEAGKEDDKPAPKEDDKAKDAGAYDELKKMVADLGEKISAMSKPKDEAGKEDEKPAPKEDDKAKDDDVGAGLEDRLKALEAQVAKLLEAKAGDESEESEDEDEDEDGDEDESEDDDFEESTMTGDTASRAEILAPGIKAKKEVVKVEALKAAYQTKEGKKVIEVLTGGKAPTFDSAEKVDALFVGASELLKIQRMTELARTKTPTADSEAGAAKGPMTAEQLNVINAKHYSKN